MVNLCSSQKLIEYHINDGFYHSYHYVQPESQFYHLIDRNLNLIIAHTSRFCHSVIFTVSLLFSFAIWGVEAVRNAFYMPMVQTINVYNHQQIAGKFSFYKGMSLQIPSLGLITSFVVCMNWASLNLRRQSQQMIMLPQYLVLLLSCCLLTNNTIQIMISCNSRESCKKILEKALATTNELCVASSNWIYNLLV
jgi:hypothetical protein